MSVPTQANAVLMAYEQAKRRNAELESRLAHLEEGLRRLYEYTVALEEQAGSFLISHGGSFPKGGEEIGKEVRSLLADQGGAARRYTMDEGAVIPTDCPAHEFVGRPDRWCESCGLPDRHPVHRGAA